MLAKNNKKQPKKETPSPDYSVRDQKLHFTGQQKIGHRFLPYAKPPHFLIGASFT